MNGGIFLDGQNEKKKTQINRPQQEKAAWDLRQYVTVALVVFVTFCCCILFFFMIYRYHGFADFWRNLSRILQPIIIGVVLAYLLNPVMKFFERYLLKFLKPRVKSVRKAKKTARAVGIAGALVCLFGICVLLVAAIVPSISASIQSMVTKFPNEVNNLVAWADEVAKGDTQLGNMLEQLVERGSDLVESFFQDDIFSKIQTYLTSITSGVIYGVKFALNVVVGIIVSVYVMASKETFAGQAKKIIYALFKPVLANIIVETVRKSNEIFGGFISGKILDSAIIGVLAYIVLAIMRMPDTVLVAVIVGVTNVIPFFGPFIGAIPSFIIIVLQSPLQGLYFLIFIVILQQIDGNIIGPKILGDSTGLSSFWVVFAILVFGGLWGFIGMLLGVPITAVVYYIAKKLISHFLKKRGLPVDTSEYVELTRVDKYTNKPVYEKASGEGRKIGKKTKETKQKPGDFDT